MGESVFISILITIGTFLAAADLPLREAPGAEPVALATIAASKDTVRGVSFSPDGKTLATVGYDNAVRLWEVPSGRSRAAFSGHTDRLLSVAFLPDGRALVSGGLDGVRLWDVATGREKARMEAKGTYTLAISPDGETLATGGAGSGDVSLWDLGFYRTRATLKGKTGDDTVIFLTFSPEDSTCAVASFDMKTKYSLDGARIVSGNGATVSLWDTFDRREPSITKRFEGIVGQVWSVAISPDGKTLAAGTEDREVRRWDVATGREGSSFKGHKDMVHGVAFSPDGRVLASASMDKTLKLWDLMTGRELADLTGHSKAVKCVAFSPDGKTVASGSWDGTAKLWDVSGVTSRRPGG